MFTLPVGTDGSTNLGMDAVNKTTPLLTVFLLALPLALGTGCIAPGGGRDGEGEGEGEEPAEGEGEGAAEGEGEGAAEGEGEEPAEGEGEEPAEGEGEGPVAEGEGEGEEPPQRECAELEPEECEAAPGCRLVFPDCPGCACPENEPCDCPPCDPEPACVPDWGPVRCGDYDDPNECHRDPACEWAWDAGPPCVCPDCECDDDDPACRCECDCGGVGEEGVGEEGGGFCRPRRAGGDCEELPLEECERHEECQVISIQECAGGGAVPGGDPDEPGDPGNPNEPPADGDDPADPPDERPPPPEEGECRERKICVPAMEGECFDLDEAACEETDGCAWIEEEVCEGGGDCVCPAPPDCPDNGQPCPEPDPCECEQPEACRLVRLCVPEGLDPDRCRGIDDPDECAMAEGCRAERQDVPCRCEGCAPGGNCDEDCDCPEPEFVCVPDIPRPPPRDCWDAWDPEACAEMPGCRWEEGGGGGDGEGCGCVCPDNDPDCRCECEEGPGGRDACVPIVREDCVEFDAPNPCALKPGCVVSWMAVPCAGPVPDCPDNDPECWEDPDDCPDVEPEAVCEPDFSRCGRIVDREVCEEADGCRPRLEGPDCAPGQECGDNAHFVHCDSVDDGWGDDGPGGRPGDPDGGNGGGGEGGGEGGAGEAP